MHKEKFVFLFLIISCISCSEKPKVFTIPVSRDYQFEIELTDQFENISPEMMEKYQTRGLELTKEINIDVSGFTELLLLENEKNKVMVVKGQHDEEKYGDYQEQRIGRANFYKSVVQKQKPQSVTMDSTTISLGQLDLKKFFIKGSFGKTKTMNIDPTIYMRYYEGLLDFILRSFV